MVKYIVRRATAGIILTILGKYNEFRTSRIMATDNCHLFSPKL